MSQADKLSGRVHFKQVTLYCTNTNKLATRVNGSVYMKKTNFNKGDTL